VRGLWREAVVETDAHGRSRVNRITYEICVLEALREQLRCKEIWVVGANRYRNPDEDVPADFETQRTSYYQALNLPLEADRFVVGLQEKMRKALHTFNTGLARNSRVRINEKAGGWISVTPLIAQPEPTNLAALKAEITEAWPMTSLLDMLKETDLRLNFTDALRSPTAYETLDRAILRPRLLLCLHGIGTNAGLQRMNAAQHGATYKDLVYVRRRYIAADQLRRAIAIVTNGTLIARNPAIWGEGTTACASDSKHFGAWDQNLTTQWHVRYGGRGIMIYWHVERKSLCIHSQLKSPSSSEVAAMIEGSFAIAPKCQSNASTSTAMVKARLLSRFAISWGLTSCRGLKPSIRSDFSDQKVDGRKPTSICSRSSRDQSIGTWSGGSTIR